MHELSSEGRRAVADLARRTGFSENAVTAMLFAVVAGNGRMAQFSHPEFGGSGQWMGGGAIMLSDMFNNALKARVDALCSELSALVVSEPGLTVTGSFQSQSQGGVPFAAPFAGGRSSLIEPEASGGPNWWPADLGSPASVGAQNSTRYAFFPASRRLAIDVDGAVTVYDTGDHQIGGFSQQQSGSGSFSFTSQYGAVDVARLPKVAGAAAPEPPATTQPAPPAPLADAAAPAAPSPPPAPPAPPASRSAPSSAPKPQPAGTGDVLAIIEKLADLRAKGVLTEEEFSAKKAELLSRL